MKGNIGFRFSVRTLCIPPLLTTKKESLGEIASYSAFNIQFPFLSIKPNLSRLLLCITQCPLWNTYPSAPVIYDIYITFLTHALYESLCYKCHMSLHSKTLNRKQTFSCFPVLIIAIKKLFSHSSTLAHPTPIATISTT